MTEAQTLTPSRPPLGYLFVPFTDLERGVLERFVRKIEALQDSEFPKADLNIIATPCAGPGPRGGQGWSFGLDGPDEREVKAVIGDFRQIYTDHNPNEREQCAQDAQATRVRARNRFLTPHDP